MCIVFTTYYILWTVLLSAEFVMLRASSAVSIKVSRARAEGSSPGEEVLGLAPASDSLFHCGRVVCTPPLAGRAWLRFIFCVTGKVLFS